MAGLYLGMATHTCLGMAIHHLHHHTPGAPSREWRGRGVRAVSSAANRSTAAAALLLLLLLRYLKISETSNRRQSVVRGALIAL